MDENGFPGKSTRLIKGTMDGVRCCVKISGGLLGPFETRRGLRQGDGLSCLLFNIALEGVMRRFSRGPDSSCATPTTWILSAETRRR